MTNYAWKPFPKKNSNWLTPHSIITFRCTKVQEIGPWHTWLSIHKFSYWIPTDYVYLDLPHLFWPYKPFTTISNPTSNNDKDRNLSLTLSLFHWENFDLLKKENTLVFFPRGTIENKLYSSVNFVDIIHSTVPKGLLDPLNNKYYNNKFYGSDNSVGTTENLILMLMLKLKTHLKVFQQPHRATQCCDVFLLVSTYVVCERLSVMQRHPESVKAKCVLKILRTP